MTVIGFSIRYEQQIVEWTGTVVKPWVFGQGIHGSSLSWVTILSDLYV